MPVGVPTDAETIRKHRTWIMIYGVLLILLGALAIIVPGVATIAAKTLLGWLLIASGAIGLFTVFTAGVSAPGFIWNLLTAVLYLLAGVALLANPVAGVLTLTIIIAAYLIATGLAKIVLAFRYRQDIPKAWGWMLFSALVDIALGVLIVSGLPGTAVWVLGLLVGIDLFLTGIALVAAAVHSRSMSTGGTSPLPA